MTTFVLVHGAWGGGWQWRPVAACLRDAGHYVFTPTLTGLGERAHLISPDVDLETHIRDILGVFDYERLDDVALVGHSYGGMVVSGVADRIPEKIRALVYIDAALPEDGQAMLDLVSAERKKTVIGLAESDGEGYKVPDTLVLETGIEDPAERTAFLARTCAHPLAALLQPIKLDGNHLSVPNNAYVFAALNNSHRFREYKEWAAAQPGWVGEELPTYHFPMATMPRETAELLMRLAA